MYDAIIIGAGVIGTSVARELSKYDLKILLVDKSYDVSNGTTKANSAIVHAGYDAKPGTLMAKFNVEGNSKFDKVCSELSVPFKRIGSLVLAFNDKDLEHIKMLYDRGIENKVPSMKLFSAEDVIGMEPEINPDIKGALFAETAGVVSPYELAIAYAENASKNGVGIKLNCEVLNVEKKADGFLVFTNLAEFETKTVINAAGVYSDKINDMVSDIRFRITPKKGQYLLLNKLSGNLVNHVIFQCPTEKGKGILVTPTVYGNLLIGPDSQVVESRDDVSVDENNLEYIKDTAVKSVKNIPFKRSIKTFAGLRAEADTGDFIIGESKDAPGFFNAAGIKSPGLTSAPAVGEYLCNLIKDKLLASANVDFIASRSTPMLQFMDKKEKDILIASNEKYKQIICRCERISEGEILDAMSRTPKPTTKDGVKRRCRAGMGPCQGNHCGPIVEEMLKYN